MTKPRIGQSFTREQAKALNEVLRVLDRGGDPRVLMRTEAYRGARALISTMAKRAELEVVPGGESA